MSRGVTIRIKRADAVREIGRIMRTRKAQFDRDKQSLPKQIEATRKLVIAACDKKRKAAQAAKSLEALREIARADLIEYQTVNKFPAPPSLSLCREQQLLTMLQSDVRDIIPINSNHDMWAVLQGKCETQF